MPAALIQPAVPPPTMTTRNGGDRLSSRISELDADTELVAPINPRPTRIHVNRFGPRSCCGITKYLLLVLCPGIQQIGHIERQLDMGVDRVSDRPVEEPRSLLEHRQTDAAIQILRQVHGAPVVSEA